MKKALIQMSVAVILWGFTGVLGRAISLDAPVLVWYRMLFTAVFMAAIVLFRREWVTLKAKDILKLAGIGSVISLHWVAFYASIKFANISVALVCLSTAGVFTSLLDPFVNKGKHNLAELLLGFLAIVGVYLIYRYQVSFGVGIVFGLIAAILSSVFTILNKRISNRFPARTIVFYEMATGFVFVSALIFVYFYYMPDKKFWPANPAIFGIDWYRNDWLWLVVMSLCCTVWAQFLALSALKKLSSFTATLSVNLEPVYGILLAFLFYNENKEIIFLNHTTQLNFGFIMGMGLILLSVAMQMFRILSRRSV